MQPKKLFLAFATAILVASCTQSSLINKKPAIAPDAQMEREIDQIISKMSLEDKVGQMTQLTLDVIT